MILAFTIGFLLLFFITFGLCILVWSILMWAADRKEKKLKELEG